MHNLRRLLAGLNRKYNIHEIGALPADAGREFKGAVVNVGEIYAGEDDWQDKSEFEREQSVEMGIIAERDPGRGLSKGGATAKRTSGDVDGGVDKKARKKAKKERRLKTKQAKGVDI